MRERTEQVKLKLKRIEWPKSRRVSEKKLERKIRRMGRTDGRSFYF